MRVLIVDDDHHCREAMRDALESSMAPTGHPFEVTTAQDASQALAILTRTRFDVVVTDMVMGESGDEGIGVVRQLANRSPITIVVTAYPTFRTCVESIRAGAWDYIEKCAADGTDPYSSVLASIRRACADRPSYLDFHRSNPETLWVQQHLSSLLEQYAGEVIAVLDDVVVDHDVDYAALAARLDKRFPHARPSMVSLPANEM